MRLEDLEVGEKLLSLPLSKLLNVSNFEQTQLHEFKKGNLAIEKSVTAQFNDDLRSAAARQCCWLVQYHQHHLSQAHVRVKGPKPYACQHHQDINCHRLAWSTAN